jgi:hypothetical protein
VGDQNNPGELCCRESDPVVQGTIVFLSTPVRLVEDRKGFFSPVFYPPTLSEMGKEQELLEAARTGNLAAVEKLLSGKRQSTGSGSGSSGTGGSSNISGHNASHPLSSLLR